MFKVHYGCCKMVESEILIRLILQCFRFTLNNNKLRLLFVILVLNIYTVILFLNVLWIN